MSPQRDPPPPAREEHFLTVQPTFISRTLILLGPAFLALVSFDLVHWRFPFPARAEAPRPLLSSVLPSSFSSLRMRGFYALLQTATVYLSLLSGSVRRETVNTVDFGWLPLPIQSFSLIEVRSQHPPPPPPHFCSCERFEFFFFSPLGIPQTRTACCGNSLLSSLLGCGVLRFSCFALPSSSGRYVLSRAL